MQCLKIINQEGFIPDKSAQIAADTGLTGQDFLPEFMVAQTLQKQTPEPKWKP